MMVGGIELFEAGGRDTHSDESEPDDGRWRDVRTVLGVYEIHLGSRRRGMTSRMRCPLSGKRGSSVDDVNVDPVRKQRRGIGKVVLVAQQQLKGMIARRQGYFGFGLT